MGVQFQSVPALSLYLTGDAGMSFIALGTLTGAYLLPGVVVALAGGWLSRSLGDAKSVLGGLMLMTLGGIAGAVLAGFDVMLIARLVAGVGAVCLNVLVTKMVADWFAGRDDLPTAMGILVSSWPAGLAIAALGLPLLAQQTSYEAAMLLPAVLCAVAFLTVLIVWRAPEGQQTAKVTQPAGRLAGAELLLVVLSGLVWGAYNIAFVGAIAWMPGQLQNTGASAGVAAALASFIGWAAIVSVAFGGWLAMRVKRPDGVAHISFVVSAALLVAVPFLGAIAQQSWLMALVGLSLGPAAAMIMTLPVEAADASRRGAAMGLYFALYYALMGLAPPILGALRDATDTSAAPLFAAGVLLVVSGVLMVLFRLLQRRRKAVLGV